MIGQGGDRPNLDIAGGAKLERDFVLQYRLSKGPKFEPILAKLTILDESNSVANSFGPNLKRLSDEFQTGKFGGMDGEVGSTLQSSRDRLAMIGGREPGLGPGKVKGNYTTPTIITTAEPPHARLGHF